MSGFDYGDGDFDFREGGRFGGYDSGGGFADGHDSTTGGASDGAMFGVGAFQRHGFDPYGAGGLQSETGAPGAGFLQSQVGGDPRHSGAVEGPRSLRFMPLKIGMIHNAWLKDSSSFGISVLHVKIDLLRLVGVVREIEYSETSAKLSFILDDGSGCIPCDWALGDDLSPWKKELLMELREPFRHVKVYGDVNTFGKSEPHVTVHVARLLSHPDELQFHDIDVCYHLIRIAQSGGLSASNTIGRQNLFDPGQGSSGGY